MDRVSTLRNPEFAVGNERCVGPRLFNGTLYHGFNVYADLPTRDKLDSSYDYTRINRDDSGREFRNQRDMEVQGRTLGHGLYTTDNPDWGRYYVANPNLDKEKPAKMKLLTLDVDNARMYDFRDPEDMNKNGIVPKEVAQKWLVYYKDHKQELINYTNDTNQNNLARWRVWTTEIETYEYFLENFLKRYNNPEALDINNVPPGLPHHTRRNLFGIGKEPRDMSILDMMRSFGGDLMPMEHSYAGLWAEFVQVELGCDGIIAQEQGFTDGGSGDRNLNPSYVLYNLSKITSQTIE
jgi:hypothetical protein